MPPVKSRSLIEAPRQFWKTSEWTKTNIRGFLPEDLDAILRDWDKNSLVNLSREVAIGDKVFDETVHLVPQFNVARIYGRDITERKRAEEALRESEGRFRALTETSSLAVGVSSSDGKFLYVNKAYEKLFGYTQKELNHLNASELWRNPEDRRNMIDAVRSKGFLMDYEVELKRKDGTPFWAMLSVNSVDYGGNQAIMASVYDITERKQDRGGTRGNPVMNWNCAFRRGRRHSGSRPKRFLQAKKSFACSLRPCPKLSGLREQMGGTSISTNSGWTTQGSRLKKATVMAGTNRSTPMTGNAPGTPGKMR